MNNKKTLIITQNKIKEILTIKETIDAVEEAFRLYGHDKVEMPPKMYLTFNKGDLRCMPAYIPDMNAAGVKNVNVHPGNKDIPTVMATMTLVDLDTGYPIAIMDATYITKMRTGAAGGIAAKYIARKDSKTAGFIGTGVQAESQLDALMTTMPGISKVIVYDSNAEMKEAFAKNYCSKYAVEVIIADSIEEVVIDSDILITTTPVRTPIIRDSYVKDGLHINAIGADAKGKQELESAIVKRARVIIDNWEQASHSGEINIPFAEGFITKDSIYANIGEIVTGKKPGRDNDNEITVFDSTGLAIQDLACAMHIYNKLIRDPELMKDIITVDFLS